MDVSWSHIFLIFFFLMLNMVTDNRNLGVCAVLTRIYLKSNLKFIAMQYYKTCAYYYNQYIFIAAISQETRPLEIPIVGEPNVEIFLDLIFPKGPPIFFLNGKKLQLLSPIDKDEDNLSHILFQLACTVKSTHKKKTYPVIVRLTDINDNAPEFVNAPYVTTISEVSICS